MIPKATFSLCITISTTFRPKAKGRLPGFMMPWWITWSVDQVTNQRQIQVLGPSNSRPICAWEKLTRVFLTKKNQKNQTRLKVASHKNAQGCSFLFNGGFDIRNQFYRTILSRRSYYMILKALNVCYNSIKLFAVCTHFQIHPMKLFADTVAPNVTPKSSLCSTPSCTIRT